MRGARTQETAWSAPIGEAAGEGVSPPTGSRFTAPLTLAARLRGALRLVLVLALSLPMSLVVALANLLPGLSPRRRGRWIDSLVHAWARMLLPILGVRVRIEGPLPRPPFFLVTNHLSYLDIPVLYSCLRTRFLSKAEVAGWPGLGIVTRWAGTIYIDRQRARDLSRVLPQIEASLAEGRGIVVFPEGTSTRGAEVLRFKPSIFEVPIRTGTPVSYGAISYRTPEGAPPAHLSVAWWGDADFTPHFLALLTLPRIDATVTFGEKTLAGEDRKQLALEAHAAVAGRFTPLVAGEPEPLEAKRCAP